MKEVLQTLNEIKNDVPWFSDRILACSRKIKLYLENEENKDILHEINLMLRDLVVDLDDINQDGLADDLHMLL